MLLNDNLVADHTRLTARLDYITRRSRVRIPPKRTFGSLCSSVGRASNCLIDNFVDRFYNSMSKGPASPAQTRHDSGSLKLEERSVKGEAGSRFSNFELPTSNFKLQNCRFHFHLLVRVAMRVQFQFFAITKSGAE